MLLAASWHDIHLKKRGFTVRGMTMTFQALSASIAAERNIRMRTKEAPGFRPDPVSDVCPALR